ncbi:MAG: VCBS repeat-containing protein [Cyclobacteriaceae bacterium]|nr:VCBS repeat-containing protein [Cyclobacteriaceae bacterium]
MNRIYKTLAFLVLLCAWQQAMAQNFITQWNLATAGSGATQLSFGTATSGVVNYTWQELSPGSATGSGSWSGSTLIITGLPAGATVRLQIAPTNFQRININNGGDRNRLTLVEQWGSTAWTDMSGAFFGCANLQVTATDVPNLLGVTNMAGMFAGCTNLNSPTNINTWNTAAVTNMSFMFDRASAFNQNIGAWNTAAVTTMQQMFYQASAFNQNIGSWNTGAVTNMAVMFNEATAFNQNIGAWNTASVTLMSFMFADAISFNQNISSWNTAAVTFMNTMFDGASAFNQSLGAWTLNPAVNLNNMFNNSGMDCNNYSATLIGWSANPSTPNGRTLGATGRQYGTNADAARTNLTTTKGWTITGDAPSGSACGSLLPPTITSFTPFSGPIGTNVTINGTNFDITPANNIVYFGATRATVTAATSTQLTVNVPTGATYAPITILNTSTSLLAYSTSNFTATFTPSKGSITTADFATKVDFTVGTGAGARSVAIGDLDGDGKADLVVSNQSIGVVSVFRNTSSSGTISYAAKVDFTTGVTPLSVAIGDLDGDGKADLAVANFTSNTVSVLRNTSTTPGMISYTAKVDFTAGASPYSVAIGDLDGDGKADLAVANRLSNTVSVFRNTGSSGTISYAAKVDFTTGSLPNSVAISDLDGDGKADLAVANTGSSVSVFRNLGSPGTINYAAKVDFTANSQANWVATGDLDGDNKSDLAIGYEFGTAVSVFRNLSSPGNINYAAKVDFTTGDRPYSVAIGDLDGDGKPDLAVSNENSFSVSVLRNTGSSGTISYAAKVDFATGASPYSVAIGDQDGDGKSDLVAANYVSNTVSVIRNNSVFPPTITSFSPLSGPIGTTVTITGTNFDATPSNNIVYFGATRATVTAATSTQLTVTVPTGATYQPITVQVAGLTGFSSKPFVVTFAGGGSINACSFAPKVDLNTIGSTNLANAVKGTIVDLDGDGKIDIVMGDNLANSISIYRNISSSGTLNTGSFAPQLELSTGTPSGGAPAPGPVTVYHGDLDGDGKPDLVATNYTNGYVSVFRNTSTVGAISFSSRVDFPSGSFVGGGKIYDIDGDGKLDIVFVPYFEGVAVLRNTSTVGVIDASSFAPKIVFDVGSNPFPFAIGDLDGDGKPEISVANAGGVNTMSIIRNLSTPGTLSFAPKLVLPTDGSVTSSIADIDGDGKLDLLTNGGSLTVYRNTSALGSISFSTTSIPFNTGITGGYQAAFGDLDGDGKTDVAIASYPVSGISILKNNSTPGSISFTSQTSLPANLNPFDMNLGDLDGDGKNDLLTTTRSLSIYRNIIGEIPPPTLTNFSPTSGPIGTSVTITGTNFSTPFANMVEFNGVPATITASTATTLTVDVPAGAITGAIEVTIGCNTVTAGIFCLLAAPTATGNAGCSGTTVTLTASGASPGQYRWYTMPTGGTADATQQNDAFITPAITINTSYWVAINDGTCESSRTEAVATVLPLPNAPGITPVNPVCPSSTVTLTASGTTDGNYRWYEDGTLLPGEINAELIVASVTTNRIFQAAIFDGTCESNRTSITVTVKNCTAPVIAPVTTTAFLEGTVTINLCALISDAEDDLDASSIQAVGPLTSGAAFTIDGCTLTINYAGVPFPGTDRLTIRACDQTGLCTEQEVSIELGGEITVYNALSPNGDGKNDNFYIQYIDVLPEAQQNRVTIYNRWGDVVWSASDYNNTTVVFKGVGTNDKELPTGTYFYKLEFATGKPRTGFISLKR